MFIEIHTLHSHSASLLNRDDSGLAKRIDFGGYPRIRVSSQCLKKHWRDDFINNTQLPSAIRSREIFERKVLPLVVSDVVSEEQARLFIGAFIEEVIDGGLAEDPKLSLATKQPVLVGRAEVDYLGTTLSTLAKEFYAETPSPKDKQLKAAIEKHLKAKNKGLAKNFAALFNGSSEQNVSYGIETALFGRFITSKLLARTDSAVAVAHSQTTHAASPEVDFFSVVDDLNSSNEGAGHIGETELNAGVFYGYVVIDVAALVSNMTGCDPKNWQQESLTEVKNVLRHLFHAICEVSPGAKTGSTAPFTWADFVMAQVTTRQPRSLNNAFLKPVKAREHDLLTESTLALSHYVNRADAMYGLKDTHRAFATTVEAAVADKLKAPQLTIDELVESVLAQVS